MLRTLLVGILAVTGAAACSSKGDAPAAVPGATAGKVIELAGTVTATRANQVRTLVAGSEISADDVIDTAADSRVVILVAHNNARWDLGPNKHGKVDESLAWTAAKQTAPAVAVIEESSTAGAHAEKSAATTDTTTPEVKAERATQSKAMQGKGAEPAPAAAAPAPPPAPPSVRVEEERRRGPAASSPPRPTVQPMTHAVPHKVMDNAAEQVEGASGGGSSDVVAGARRDEADPVRDLELEIQRTFAKGRSEMRACFEPTAPNALIQITVTKGVYTITTVGRGATNKARACLATIAKGLSSTTKLDKPVYIKLTLAKP